MNGAPLAALHAQVAAVVIETVNSAPPAAMALAGPSPTVNAQAGGVGVGLGLGVGVDGEPPHATADATAAASNRRDGAVLNAMGRPGS